MKGRRVDKRKVFICGGREKQTRIVVDLADLFFASLVRGGEEKNHVATLRCFLFLTPRHPSSIAWFLVRAGRGVRCSWTTFESSAPGGSS
jgi:hypothetical protein